jgi:hypothetical protein
MVAPWCSACRIEQIYLIKPLGIEPGGFYLPDLITQTEVPKMTARAPGRAVLLDFGQALSLRPELSAGTARPE